MATPGTVDDYLARLPDDRRPAMDALRSTIRAAAPDAVEVVSYQMPAFKLDGRFLVSYAAFQRHISMFPASAMVLEALGDEVRPYLHGKGTIRFALGTPLPLELVSRIVAVRLAEHAGMTRS